MCKNSSNMVWLQDNLSQGVRFKEQSRAEVKLLDG